LEVQVPDPVPAPARIPANAGRGAGRPHLALELLENAELFSALFMPFVQEFRHMQQQMLEHFDRSLSLMSRAFEIANQDRQNLRQSERQGLQQLQAELQDLHRKVAARSLDLRQPRTSDLLPLLENGRPPRPA